MSLTTPDAQRVLDAARAAGVAHGINYQYRMNAAVLEMRGRIRTGDAGRPLYVSGRYLQESSARVTDDTPRRIPETSPARAVLDIGVHWADTASFVMGMPIAKVYAKMYTHYPIRIDPATGREIPVHSDDTTSILLEFADVSARRITARRSFSVPSVPPQDGIDLALTDRMAGSLLIGRGNLPEGNRFSSVRPFPEGCQKGRFLPGADDAVIPSIMVPGDSLQPPVSVLCHQPRHGAGVKARGLRHLSGRFPFGAQLQRPEPDLGPFVPAGSTGVFNGPDLFLAERISGCHVSTLSPDGTALPWRKSAGRQRLRRQRWFFRPPGWWAHKRQNQCAPWNE